MSELMSSLYNKKMSQSINWEWEKCYVSIIESKRQNCKGTPVLKEQQHIE